MSKRFVAKRFIDYYDSPTRKYSALSRLVACSPDGITVTELTARSGLSEGSVRHFITEVHDLNYVHISGWKRLSSFSLSPIYKLGKAKDVPKQPAKTSKAKAEKAQPIEDTPDRSLQEHCAALLKALVPTRNEQEQRAVNRLYLNWISEGAYG
jgi:hypothetical protein